MSNLISLPHDLKLSYLYEDKPLDLSNWSPLQITFDDQLIIETKDGILVPHTMKEILDLLCSYSVLFTYSPPGRDDAILTPLSDNQLVFLNVFGKVETDGVEIRKVRNSMRLGSTPIFNLISQTTTYRGDSLEICNKTAREIIESRSDIGLFNVSSGAAEARALMLQDDRIVRDILLSKKLGLDAVDKFNSACHGGRMESSGLGTQYHYHLDMIKAHLNILKDYPGLEGTQWVRGTNTRFFDRALPHSVYFIKTVIPKRFKYNPLPVKTEAGTKFPLGEVKGWYFKDYLTLLTKLKIPFKILDSIQFTGTPLYPFRSYTSFLSAVIKLFDLNYPDLECKHLYATIAGSCKSIYKEIEKDLHQQHKASRVFNPVLYGFVLTRQNVELYLKSLETNADAIKIDSVATLRQVHSDDRFKLKAEGMSTYLTPALKSLPSGKSLYKEAIKRCRDLDHVVVEINQWNSLQSYLSDCITGPHTSTGLGQQYKRTITIKPHYGNRVGTPIKRVGDLLESWLISNPGEGRADRDIALLNLEEYWERFSGQ